MKARESLIAWNYGGDVKIGPLLKDGDADWTKPFIYTGGAAYTDVRGLRGTDSTARLLVDFVCMAVRDKVDPLALHREFMKVDEYRTLMPEDMPAP